MTERQEHDPGNVHAKVYITRYKNWTYAAHAAPSSCPNEEVQERGARLTNSEESELYALFFQVGMSPKNYSKDHGSLPPGAPATVIETNYANFCLVEGVAKDYAVYVAPPDWSGPATRQGGHKLRMSEATFVMRMLVRTGLASLRWARLECRR